jgi:hypothetical protein
MSMSNFLLREGDSHRIKSVLVGIQKELHADLVLLLDRGGQQISAEGSVEDFDLTSISSLAAANLAATDGLARLIGEPQFAALYHQGNQRSIHISSLAGEFTLVLVFREAVFSGRLRWKVRKSAASLEHAVTCIMNEIEAQIKTPALETSSDTVPFFTDEEIDKLFKHLTPKSKQEREA